MMNTPPSNLISRSEFDSRDLINTYPLRFRCENKRLLWEHINPADCTRGCRISVSRWSALDLPHKVIPGACRCRVELRPTFFEYEPTPSDSGLVEWHLNFAHSDLFCAYGSGPFAQDEIQVAEHPALANLREALLSLKCKPLTVEKGKPTPILITGVERLCSISTGINAEGVPRGIYGRQFEIASPDTIRGCTRILSTPTLTNLIAMEAPSYGEGAYTRQQIEYILIATLTGFACACLESDRLNKSGMPTQVVIHTGFWGCGAYGGNRTMMSLLQILAANLAGIDRIVFHTGDAKSFAPVEAAVVMSDQLFGGSPDDRLPQDPVFVSQIVSVIQQLEMRWGESDGN